MGASRRAMRTWGVPVKVDRSEKRADFIRLSEGGVVLNLGGRDRSNQIPGRISCCPACSDCVPVYLSDYPRVLCARSTAPRASMRRKSARISGLDAVHCATADEGEHVFLQTEHDLDSM